MRPDIALGSQLGIALATLLAAQLAVAQPTDSPTSGVSTPSAAAAAVDDEEDDDWDAKGPVDRTVHVSGVLQASYRATMFSKDTLPDGSKVSDERTFQIEHSHVKLSGDLSNNLSWELLPCLTHMNEFSVIAANFTYVLDPAAQLTVGRFLLPFGQFNTRALPGSFGTVSRPLLYQSHEDRMIQFEQGTPGPFIFTPRDDTGVQLSGSFWMGPDDSIQLSYTGFYTNGLRGSSDQSARFWDDNNNGKQLGGRLSVGYNGDAFSMTGAGSVLSNKYEGDLNQLAWSADAVVAYQYAQGRRVTLRGEYVDSKRDIVPTDTLLKGDEETTGAYTTVEVNILSWLSAFYQWDTLKLRAPRAQLNEKFRDVEWITNRHAGGLDFTVDGQLHVRTEYGLWRHSAGVPDAQRVSIQTIVPF